MPPKALHTANALLDQGKLDQAVAVARRALASSPRDPDLLALLGFASFMQGNLAQCEHYSKALLAQYPRHARVNGNFGAVLLSQGRFEEAETPLRIAIEVDPLDHVSRAGLVKSLIGQFRLTDARQTVEDGLALAPGQPSLLESLADLLHATGRIDDAYPILNELVQRGVRTPTLPFRWAILHTYAAGLPGITRERSLAAHQYYARSVEAPSAPRPAARSPRTLPLRLALHSPDFRHHSVASVTAPFIQHADRSKVHITCFSTSPREDAVTARIRAASDQFRAVATLGDADLAAAIARERPDILLDLAGLTNGARPAMLARRPAPLIGMWAGYPDTMGLTQVDFRIVDPLTDPHGSDAYSTERLLRLPPTFTVYRPPEAPPEVGPLPARANGFVTFAAFGSLLKYNATLISLWARVLREVPGSRLLLKHFNLSDTALQQEIILRFEDAGAPRGSVIPVRPPPGTTDHLATYAQADISLDTYPYNGTVTILESLLMGVPVVSLAGDTTASRMGLSLLSAAGLPELCARSHDEFIEAAAKLAADLPRLSALREGLRRQLLTSPLCDGPGFARRMETLLIDAWNATPASEPR